MSLIDELNNVKAKEQELREVRASVFGRIAPLVKSYFQSRIQGAPDYDTRRDFAALLNTEEFIVNDDNSLTFLATSYKTVVSHTVTLEELTSSD